MRSILLLFFLLSFLSTSAVAANYACRDSKGTLYFSDNLLSLPDDCRKNLHQIEHLGNSDQNASPPAEQEKSIEQSETSKDQIEPKEIGAPQAAEWQRKAAASAEKYAQGISDKEEARKRRDYGSRTRFAVTHQMLDAADKLINEARQEKQDLLDELDSQEIAGPQRAEIKKLLEAIH